MSQIIHENCTKNLRTGNSYLPMVFAIENRELAQAVFVKLNEGVLKSKSA